MFKTNERHVNNIGFQKISQETPVTRPSYCARYTAIKHSANRKSTNLTSKLVVSCHSSFPRCQAKKPIQCYILQVVVLILVFRIMTTQSKVFIPFCFGTMQTLNFQMIIASQPNKIQKHFRIIYIQRVQRHGVRVGRKD